MVEGFQEETSNLLDSPTAARETLRIFCSISANERWEVECSDVRSAFLQSDIIDRDIYVEPPPEKYKVNTIWKLNKPLYGLGDASRQWYLSLSKTLEELGMKQSMNVTH